MLARSLALEQLEWRRLPTAPSSFSATEDGDDEIDLSWSDASGETGYQLQRSLTSNFASVVSVNLSANATSYSWTGLNGNTTYYFRLRATNTGGNSSFVSDSDTTDPSSGAMGIGFTPYGPGQGDLTWGNNGADYYIVYRGDANGENFTESWQTTDFFWGVDELSTYTYRVTSVIGTTESAPSNIIYVSF